MKLIRRSSAKWTAILIAALAIATVISAGVRVPFSLNTYGRVVPMREWTLTKGNNGELISSIFSHLSGQAEGYSVIRSPQDGSMSFTLMTTMVPGGIVSRGDTIGRVYSSDTEERLIELQGQLDVARAQLAAEATGEKEALVRQAKNELLYVQTAINTYRKRVERLQSLREKNLISQEEFEMVSDSLRLLQIEEAVAQAQLEVVSTGGKKEQLAFLAAYIQSLRRDIQALRSRKDSFHITAPISGRVERVEASDTLVTISDTSAFVVLMLLKWDDSRYVATSQPPIVNLSGIDMSATAELVSVESDMRVADSRQVVLAVGRITESTGKIYSGAFVECSLACPSVTVLELVKRTIGSIMS